MNNFNRQELIDALEILFDGDLEKAEINLSTDEELIWKIITIAYFYKDKSEKKVWNA